MIQAGFYETDITPPLGSERPGDFRKILIRNISDSLKIRAVVLTDGISKVAMVGLDNIGCGEGFRKKVEAMLPEFSLIISASHTHYGGNLRDKVEGIESASEEMQKIVLIDAIAHDPDYYAFCLKQFVTAVEMAASHLTEAEFSFGRRRVENLIFNRRIRMKDGTVQTHPGKGNPDALDYAGPVDDELGVVGVWAKGTDKLLGCILNFSCHACISLEGATADFPGFAVDTVKRVYGPETGVVYINGASGDVTQIDNLSLKQDKGRAIAVKLGRTVGARAVEILATADHGEVNTLRYLTSNLILTRNLPSQEYLKEAWDIVHKDPDSPAALFAKSKIRYEFTYRNDPHPIEKLCVLQLGPLVIGSSSGEMFAQYGLDFKAASPFPYTWYSQIASNQMGYIPTPDCFGKTGGGYETSTSNFPPETGPQVLATLNDLVSQLTPEEEPQPQLVKPQSKTWAYNFDKK